MQNDMEWECARPGEMIAQVPFNVHGHGQWPTVDAGRQPIARSW
jgi:hypothetical protein